MDQPLGSPEEGARVTVYVSLPQVPLTLKFEEPHDEVLDHFQSLIEDGSVHRYALADGQSLIVNYGVIAAATLNDGHRTLEVAEMHRGVQARITTPRAQAGGSGDADDPIEV
jgi:hypothetical protein